jgi:hypothetical protein
MYGAPQLKGFEEGREQQIFFGNDTQKAGGAFEGAGREWVCGEDYSGALE